MAVDDHTARAGRYVKQPQGYSAFIPAELPPSSPLRFTDGLRGLLHRADMALARLDSAVRALPNDPAFTFMYIRKEAVLSSRIEGTVSSVNDVLRDEADVPGQRPRDVKEVRNYIAALEYGLKRLREMPLSVRLIREIHGILLADVRGSERQPGELRTTQNWIGFPGATLAQASFVPPPAHEIGPALANLERFIHDESPTPALVKMAIVHGQFETIHPFLDGNGRAGRLLLTLMLCDQGLLSRPVLYLSEYFVQNQLRYYDLLQRLHDEGDWESWVEFCLTGVEQVAGKSAAAIYQILELRELHWSLVTAEFSRGASSALALLDLLYAEPIISVSRVSEGTGLTFRSAGLLVDRFVAMGLLEEITGQARNRRFLYTPYVEIFEKQ
ncbi:MAG: Fic family protein [Coriobacteriia bacterium]